MIRLVSSILKTISACVNEFEMVLNLGMEYICGSINVLVDSDKVYIERAQIWFIDRNTSIKRLKKQDPTTLGKISEPYEIGC